MNQLLKELAEIQNKIEQTRKLPDQRKASSEIKRLQQQAGRIALDFYIKQVGQKEI